MTGFFTTFKLTVIAPLCGAARDMPRAALAGLVLSIVALMGGLAVAVFFTGTDTPYFVPPLIAAAVMGACAWMGGFSSGWCVPRGAVIYWLLAFGGYVWLSTLWSQVPYVSILFAYVITILPLLFFIIVTGPRADVMPRVYMGAVTGVVAGFAVWALVQFFFLYDDYGPRIHHPMLSPNNLAALFAPVLFAALYFFLRARTRAAVVLSFALVALLIWAMMVTQSRGALVSTLLASVLLAAVLRGRGGVTWRRAGAVAAAMIAAVPVVNILSRGLLADNVTALGSAAPLYSLTDRLALFAASFDMWRDHFWGGIGLGSFFYSYPAYRKPVDLSDGFFTHLDPLQFGLEMGVLAPVLFYGLLVAVLLRTVRAYRAAGMMADAARAQDVRAQIMASFCGMLAVAVHTHIDFHLYLLAILMVLAVVMAWWYSATAAALGEGTRMIASPLNHNKGALWLGRGALAALLLLWVSWPLRAAQSTLDLPRVQGALQDGNLSRAAAQLEKTARTIPRSHFRFYQYQGRLAAAQLAQGRAVLTAEQAQTLYERAAQAFARAQALNRDYTALRLDEARLYIAADGWIIQDGKQRALRVAREAAYYNALDWDARLFLAQLYLERGQQQEAASFLSSMRTTWPMPIGHDSVRLLVMEAQAYQAAGNDDAYAQIMAHIATYQKNHGLVSRP